MDERRRSTRVVVNLAVKIKELHSRFAFGSRIKDLSESGACLLTKNYFYPKTLIQMEMHSDDLKAPVNTMARVVRIDTRPQSGYSYEIGAEFLNTPSDQMMTLREYLARSIKPSMQKQTIISCCGVDFKVSQ